MIQAHPRGNVGDAYLVDGVMYIWDATATPPAWKSVGSLKGPQGIAGTAILDSYETLEELQAEHPEGNVGDAYLVNGELYIWQVDEATGIGGWESVGSLVGPTGDTGPSGTAILGSYDTLAQLQAEHPEGNVGDAYLVNGQLYIWKVDEATGIGGWESAGSLVGPTGDTGPAGSIGPTGPTGESGADGIIGQIAGVVEAVADLPTTGVEEGTIYYVEEDDGVYVWDATTGEWKNVSLAQGPRGATGPTGPTGPSGADGIMGPIKGVVDNVTDLPTTGIEQGTLYYVENDGLYVWDETSGWTRLDLVQGPRGATGPTGPAGNDASSITIIPFASQQAPHVTTNNGGEPTSVGLIGFGYMHDAELVVDIDPNDGAFNLTQTQNMQVAFSLPFDMKLNSIYITVGSYATFSLPPTGTLVYPYVQIYTAPAGTNNFFPIEDAFAIPTDGINPATAVGPIMRAAYKDGLDIGLRAGTRIAICGMMQITGDTLGRAYYMHYTGGLGMTRWIE